VQAGLHDRFVEKLATAMQQLRVGNGLDEGVTIGPLIDDSAVARVREHIDDAVARGGRLVTGGRPHALGGLFFQPTLISHVPQTARVAREETFGPLAPVLRFDTGEEVIRWANDTEFGLAAYVYTRDLGRSIRMAEALEYGMVAINSGALSNEAAPFGGIKQSGLGREGSKYGMDDYVDMKYVLLGGLEG
jgi:succinate-semialdehyde dehydrogenase [NAD(P)+]